MDSRERFLTALTGGVPDRVPVFDFLFSQTIYEEVLGHRPEFYNVIDAIECSLGLGLDAVWIPAGGPLGFEVKILGDDMYIGEWGTTWKKNEYAWPIDAPWDYPLKSREDLKNYTPPQASAPGRMRPIEEAMKLNAGRLAILGGVSGPYTQAWILTGLDTFGINLYDDPQFIEDILDIVTEFNIELGLMMLDMGVDAIIIADDFGMDTGPLISPRHFREMILPRFNKMVKIFKERGVPVLLHCCGNINLLIADIVESGIDGYHPLQRTAQMDLKECKEKYGERISLVGNVDSSRTLPFGTYEDVEEETRECIRIAGPGGGYICASDHSLHDGIPMRNIWAMIETVKKYGHYPLS